MINAYHGDLDFRFPRLPTLLVWQALVDTAEPSGLVSDGRRWLPGETYRLRGRSFVLFINRAPAAARTAERDEPASADECTGAKPGSADGDAPAS
jgi:hypothetical protein